MSVQRNFGEIYGQDLSTGVDFFFIVLCAWNFVPHWPENDQIVYAKNILGLAGSKESDPEVSPQNPIEFQ